MGKAPIPLPVRGEIWSVNFDPSLGSEIQKLRPALVISVDSIGRLPLRIVVPVTDWKSHYNAFPWIVPIAIDSMNGLLKNSGADAFQTKSVSLMRFHRRVGRITSSQLDDVASAVALCVGTPQ